MGRIRKFIKDNIFHIFRGILALHFAVLLGTPFAIVPEQVGAPVWD
jgi:hypothetical protein